MIKLRTFLTLTFIAFLILLSVVLGMLMGKQATRVIQTEIGQSLSGIAYQMSDKLDNFMWSRAGEMEMLATLDTFQQMGSADGVQRLLDQLKASFPSFSWVGYTDTEGKVVAATNGILVGSNISARPVFKEGINGRFIGDVHEAVLLSKFLPNPTGEALQFVDISLPVKNAEGQTLGVLAAHLSWEWSKEVQRTVLEPQQGHIQHLDLFIVSKSDSTVLLGPQEMVGQPLILDSVKRAQQGGNGWELVKWPDGNTYLTGYAYGDGYLNYEGLGWTVLVRQPEAVAFSPVEELMDDFILICVIASVLFAIVGWLLAERISLPIRGLTTAANRLRAGEPIEIPAYKGFRELYSLSRSLRSLVESLSRTESALGSMQSLALHDKLTGLPNRAALEGYLERTVVQLDSAESLVFLYLDLDGFKKVNDTLGHQSGDLLLQQVAKRLESATLPGNLAVRLGGDEFLLLLRMPAVQAYAESEILANEIVRLLNQPFVIEGEQVSVGCSIGVAMYPEHGLELAEVIQRADECLYHSKQTGKNRVTFAGDAAFVTNQAK
ncbi:diguanylate cyclase domain-containing protein [Paenibacillus sp. y28]|uniref:diguanylate cyclase domain-containing protein n=1 Tax=Paenibacillus sp. y28 TaxID=3129110 RepID=UPI00301B1F48